MMREKLLLSTAALLRNLPDFKGKYRAGMLLEKCFLNGWKSEDVKIRLKRGESIYVDPRSFTHKAAFWTGRYDDKIIDQFLSIFQKDWVVMDVGASIGYYTLPFAKKLQQLGGGRVIAVEPLPGNLEKLKTHVQINGISDITQIQSTALGDTNGQATIFETEGGKTGNAYVSANPIQQIEVSRPVTINISRLDDLIDTWNIKRCDFLKMDIEGVEILLLKGALQFLQKFRPVIYGEFNSFFMRNMGYDFFDVHNILKPMDYVLFAKTGQFYHEASPEKDMVDVLFVPSEKIQSLKEHGNIFSR